ncbi:acyl-CoA reductase [Sinomicrobium weinanense]|uniref:Acyl-CoA reductase n=1 Tax=Sinomicrobium weinanense TaxID=2842200 RepID=A0A926JT88_9FLAO|nr:acyl-CoA reductase [Sinomicrobium weinanense]MBC9797075.1 acyl-CoA reductase [Sinomicrobium weinanense]MBU3122696.1 acyl-CoA reductase [Sinomicrobium weinanense]
MHNLDKNITAFVKLGNFLIQFSDKENNKREGVEHNELFYDGFCHQLQLAREHNGWFTKDNLAFALGQWSRALSRENLTHWLSAYKTSPASSKRVAVIMAGNIPLVGFHDFMSVLLCGHSVIVKQSSNDRHLLPYLAKYLEYAEPSFKGKIAFTEDKLEEFDAVIATGSDNTSRYFEYYFSKKPNIIRKNRNSVAVITGKETEEQLAALGEDIFRYFGLGCRNVSKLFVPENYDFDPFFKAIYSFRDILEVQKYTNNYDYNKAVYLMSLFKLRENGFLMLKEDKNYSSPIATLFYETYSDSESLQKKLTEDSEKIQCVVASGFSDNEVAFGKTQKPELWDYADGVDTVEFLLKI